MVAASVCALALSCNQGRKASTIETRSYEDTTKYVSLKMDIDLPAPKEGAESQMRNEVVSILDDQLCHITTYEDEKVFPSYEGDRNDTDALLGYYREQAFKALSQAAKDDADERIGYLMADDELSEEEFTQAVEDFPTWDYDYSFKKIDETDKYTVFFSRNYIYMGGAHGGITGAGGITFDRKTGKRIDPMIDPSSTKEIQPLLIKGLLQYYKDMEVEMTESDLLENLFIEDGIIPLPGWTPYPSAEGLVFTYQQYEIASYAEGMPSFTLPFAEVAPFLTPEAKSVLGL